MNQLYYKPSNKINPLGIILYLLIAIIGGALLSIVYLHLKQWVPMAMFSVLFCVICSIALLIIIIKAIEIGRIRNFFIAVFLIAITVVFFNYFKWAFFVGIQRNYIEFSAALSPSNLWSTIVQLNSVGTFKDASNNIPVTGQKLAFYWIAEMLILSVFPFFAAKIAKKPFSEENNCWLKDVKLQGQLQLVTDLELIQFVHAIENGNCSVILERHKYAEHRKNGYTYIQLYKFMEENSGYIQVWTHNQLGKIKCIVKAIDVGKDNANKIESYLK